MQLKENNQLKLVALLIAILLFLSVNEKFKNFSVIGNTDNVTTTWVADVPLEVDYDRDKFYVVGLPNKVSVKLTGSPSKVQKESTVKNFKVKLNLRNVDLGDDKKVKLEIEDLDKDIDGVVDPAELTLSIKEKITKEFKVTPIVQKERLLLGYEVEKLTVSNETVKVSGVAETINRIHEIRAENDIKTKINKNVKEDAKLVAYDSDYNKIEDIVIEPTTTVINVEIKTVEKEVPIVVNKIGAEPSGINIISVEPSVAKTIIRARSEEELINITELYVDVEVSDIKDEDEERSNLKLYAKEDVRISIDNPTVTVKIKSKKK